MADKGEIIPHTVRLRRDQVVRLKLICRSVEEKTGKRFTLTDLFQRIVDDFLDSDDED